MMRHGAAGLAFVLWSCATGASTPRPSAAPNVIFVLADDLGYAELGCYGQTKIRTPHIDQLAREGMRFTQHYSGSPVCAPSRCTLLTGLHTGHSFIRDNREQKVEGQLAIPTNTRTAGRLLQESGYVTGFIGKWGLGGPGSSGVPEKQGFDHAYGYLCQRHAHNHYPKYLWRNGEKVPLEGNDRGLTGAQHSHDSMTEEALQFVRDHQDRPFLLYVAYAIPHLAIQVPEDSLSEYQGVWPDPPYEGGNGYLPHPAPRAGYAAMVTRMDRDVGRIRKLLEELGLDKNTVMIFTSDNGPTYDRIGGSDSEFFQSAGELRGLKGSVYEGGIRVPLVAWGPGRIPAGAVNHQPSGFQDWLPTFAQLAGRAIPGGLDGESLLPALLGDPAAPRRSPLYFEIASYGGQQAIRDKNWKAVRTEMVKGNRQVQLFDLSEDPGETRDVGSEHPEVLSRMTRWMSDLRTPSAEFPLALDGEEGVGS